MDKCLQTIREAAQYRTLPSYKLDPDLDTSQAAAVRTVSGPVRVLAASGRIHRAGFIVPLVASGGLHSRPG